MAITDLPNSITDKYEVHEFHHSIAILKNDFPLEYNDVINVLQSFTLKKSDILTAGGRKSPIASHYDSFLYALNWKEHYFETTITVDDVCTSTHTHKIDCYRNRIALDVEWNNKDPFYDRDLNNFRLLHDRGAISLAVIITRCTELQAIFKKLGKGSSYGASTTHLGKLLPRIYGGGAGGCPLLIFGISTKLYDSTK
jgi:hypothetical protein